MRCKLLLVLACAPVITPAASFSLGAVLQAGTIFNNNLLLGPNSGGTVATVGFFPFWIDGADHPFQLAYDAPTNTATLSATWLGIFSSAVSWNPTGGTGLSTVPFWSIGAGGMKVAAANNTGTNTSVRIQNLSVSGPGLAVINPPSLTAAQNGTGTVTAANGAPITFTTTNGSWVLNGQIQFIGLIGAPGATGDQLQAAFDILATDAPEPATLLISALGFAGLGVLWHFRGRRARNKTAVAARNVTTAAPKQERA